MKKLSQQSQGQSGPAGKVIAFPLPAPSQAASVQPDKPPSLKPPVLKPGYYSAARLAELERTFRDIAVSSAMRALEAALAPEDPEAGRHAGAAGER